jgi:lipoprotein NlpD
MQWLWPTAGKVIDGFDAPRNKGVDIGGNEGDPVLAAADGEVVHVGSALRGYGNLVIIRHPGDYVTAYGHNRKILVSQGQQVKRGQQIAELGRTDSDRPKLHFEIRHQGKPLDPVKYLPSR